MLFISICSTCSRNFKICKKIQSNMTFLRAEQNRAEKWCQIGWNGSTIWLVSGSTKKACFFLIFQHFYLIPCINLITGDVRKTFMVFDNALNKTKFCPKTSKSKQTQHSFGLPDFKIQYVNRNASKNALIESLYDFFCQYLVTLGMR